MKDPPHGSHEQAAPVRGERARLVSGTPNRPLAVGRRKPGYGSSAMERERLAVPRQAHSVREVMVIAMRDRLHGAPPFCR